MLQSMQNLLGFKLEEKNGAIGHVADYYFDDRQWGVRYLVADYGNWVLGHEKVLIAPRYLGHADWTSQMFSLGLTMEQLEDSPNANTHIPISRQHHPHKIFTPTNPAYADAIESREAVDLTNPEDVNLASFLDTKGFHLEAKDGAIGHLIDLMVNDETWEVVWVVVSTHDWWPGKDVLIAPANVTRLSAEERKIYVDLTRENVKNSLD